MKVLALFYLYHLLIFLFSLALTRPGVGSPAGVGRHRFAVLIPAHDEERVIGASVRSVLGCDYPRERFDVYVIADNCTDMTAGVALAAGAEVLERRHPTRGKQHALAWAFDRIDLDRYDAVVILDADNHVDPGFLRVFDHHLAEGRQVVQGYVETKNPGDSWVTANYAYMFWYICRLQMARTRLGLSAWLAGTGFCVRTEVLRRVGWRVETMTDDVEYTCRLLLAGERVAFAPGAVVYDQKPVSLGDSLRQRLRWIRGQTQVSLRYVPQLVGAAVRGWLRGRPGQAARCLDAVLWVPMHIVIFASVVLSVWADAPGYLAAVFVSVPAFNLLPMLAERITLRRAWTFLATAGAFFLSWLPITAWGVITSGNKVWWRTPH